MRICHVITKPELGGAQLTALNIVSNLPRHKYDISIIISPRGILAREFRDIKDIKIHPSPFLIRAINPIVDIIAFIHILFLYRSFEYNIVHTHSSKAGVLGRWAARAAKVPHIIHTVHGWSFNDYQPLLLRQFFIFLERITAKFTTKIICVSEKDLETGLKNKIATREKFLIIKYGIEIAKFQKTSVNILQKRRELGIYNDDPVVGMISCLKPQKSPLDYLKACIEIYKKIPDVNFLLVGEGVLKRKCKKFLAATPLDGRFIFTGWRRDIAEILDVLDIAVLTSKWEGMSISIIEALCKGKAVVITDVGGASELVKDGVTGYLVKPGSYEEIARKTVRLLQDRRLFNEISKNARFSIDDNFDLSNMLDRIEQLYRGLS